MTLSTNVKKTTSIKTIVTIITPVALLSGLLFFSPQLKLWLDSTTKSTTNTTTISTHITDCNLTQSPCIVSFDKGIQSTVTLTNDDSSQTLSAYINSKNMPEKMNVIIEGRDMFMGITTRSLQRESEHTFIIKDLLVPACTVDPKMIWLYKVQMTYDEINYEFVFEVENAFHGSR